MPVSRDRCFNAPFNNSTASSNTSGGHAATVTCNTLKAGAEPMFATSDRQIPNTNASHATHRPDRQPARWVFQSSTVAIVNRPSTSSGQIDAVTVSAPKRSANSRPWRYEAYAAPRAISPVQAH